jgi:hypothetical protein
VQALRGRESSAKAKSQNQGWEFVSENRGKLRTELTFRRVEPKTIGAYLQNLFGRMEPRTRLVLMASCALLAVAGIAGVVSGAQGGADTTPNASAAQASAGSDKPSADPAATPAEATPSADQTTSTAAATAAADETASTAEATAVPDPTSAVDRKRASALRRWFKKEKVTPADVAALGVNDPRSMLWVYSIKKVAVHGSAVELTTELYPKQDNEDEFRGACNQVVQGYAPSWMRTVKVIGQDGAEHGLWTDEDHDTVDDNTGLVACESDLT